MKGGVAAIVAAACSAATGPGPTPDLLVVLTAGEETGCEGAFHLVANGSLPNPRGVVVGEPTANRVLAGHKGCVRLSVAFRGRGAHASMPELGDNAISRAAAAIVALETSPLAPAPHPVMGRPTLVVSRIRGGTAINMVPDRVEIALDVRTVPGLSAADVAAVVSAAVGDQAEVVELLDVPAVWTDPTAELVARCLSLAGASTAGTATYFTDASVFTPALGRPPTVIWGPGEPTQAHQTDEFCELDRINEAAELYEALVMASSR